ncbi:hypothetical protein ACHWQZ_G014928 [Mnemiopsis leidyi]
MREQDLNVPDDRAAIIGTLELNTDTAKPAHTDHVTEVLTEDTCVAGDTDQAANLARSTSETSVNTSSQTEETRSYTGVIVDSVVQGTYVGGKCLVDGCANVLKSFNIGTAPGNFTGTLKEDITQISSHLSGVIVNIGKELSLERIKYKLFL